MTLTRAGVAIYPRLEARVHTSLEGVEESVPLDERLAFDLPELDVLLNDGLTRGTITLLLGSLGTGKTLFALQWALAGASAGEPALFVGLRETQGQLLRRADAFSFGTRLRQALAPDGLLTLRRLDPIDLDPDIVADGLLEALDTTGARRLVIDSITELERAVVASPDVRRLDNYLAALLTALRARKVTTLVIKESRSLVIAQLEFSADALSILAENVLLLQQVTYQERLVRVLSVLKMRFSAHDVSLREFRIAAPAGLQVLGEAESGVATLAGITRQQGGPLVAGDGERVPRSENRS